MPSPLSSELRHGIHRGRAQALRQREVATLTARNPRSRALSECTLGPVALAICPDRHRRQPLCAALDMRLLLEGEAAERGALRIGAPDAATLAVLSVQMEAALRAADARAYLAANEEFHLILYRAAGSPMLLALIETVWLKVGPLSNKLFEHADALRVLNDAHDDVLQAIARRDGAAVRRGIERDLFVAGQFLPLACRGH